MVNEVENKTNVNRDRDYTVRIPHIRPRTINPRTRDYGNPLTHFKRGQVSADTNTKATDKADR